jgi:flagellar basal-body rod protein FlgB
MKPSGVTSYLVDRLNFASERQKVISSNIANINTPNYKAKDLVFADELAKSNSLELAKTNSMHLDTNKHTIDKKFELIQKKGVEQNDGNNVSLDTEISEMSKNNIMFEAIQTSIKKDSTWFKLMLDASGKI